VNQNAKPFLGNRFGKIGNNADEEIKIPEKFYKIN